MLSNSFNNLNNNFLDDDDWGHFIYIEDGTNCIPEQIFHSPIKKNSQHKKVSISIPVSMPLTNNYFIDKPKNITCNFEQQDKIIQFYEKTYNYVASIIITISFIYFITKT